MIDVLKSMNWQYLLTATYGRIRRRDYWIGVIAIGIAMVIVIAIMGAILRAILGPVIGLAVTSLLNIVLLAAVYPVMVKRANDRGRPVIFVQAALAVNALAYLFLAIAIALRSPLFTQIADIVLMAGMLAWLYLLVDLGILPGMPGPNEHGPDPKSVAA